LPTGFQLAEQIRVGLGFRFEASQLRKGDEALFKADEAILDLLKNRFSNVDLYVKAGCELSATIATFPSIDEALHWWRARQEIVELGKLAIAYYILGAERRSPLYGKDGSIDVEAANGTWLATFISMALSGLERDEAKRAFENVSIINFNYDRTIETYLHQALQQQGAISADGAAECVAQLKVIRPYGSIGKLDWQEQSGIRFGGNTKPEQTLEVATNNIRTFTEQIEGDTIPRSINEVLENAHLVIFLGFGFHEQNMRLLEPKTPGTYRPSVGVVIGTTKGIDNKNNTAIENFMRNRLGLLNPTLVSCKAEELLMQLRPTISMAAA
jgi:hypothetical protein